MQFGGNTGDPAWIDFAGFGDELGQKLRMLVADLFGRNIEATPRHLPVVAAQIGKALSSLGNHLLLSVFPGISVGLKLTSSRGATCGDSKTD